MIRTMHNRHKLTELVFSILLLFTIITILFNIYLNGDENFTFGLIHKSYHNIISIDTMDVHPPLYYLLLKLFLQLTTFWTNDIFIKIIFSRLFSLVSLLVIIYFGIKILSLFNIRYNLMLISIIYFTIPSIMLYSQYIRMYILAAMFLFIELYNILKYIKSDKINSVIVSLIAGLLASYTHYFAAISAGMFLLYFFIMLFIKKKYKKSLIFMLIGIIYFICYLPWLFIAEKQFTMATSGQYNTNQMYTKSTYSIYNIIQLIRQSLSSFVGGQNTYGQKGMYIILPFLLILFIYLIYWSINVLNNKFNKLLIISIINLLGTIFVGLVISIIKHPIIIDRYLFPSYAIFAFFMSYIIYKYIIFSFFTKKWYIYISYLLILMLTFNMILYYKYNITGIVQSRIMVMRIINLKKLHSSFIYIKNTKNTIWNVSENSIYLHSINKYVKTNNFNNSQYMFGKVNKHLFHEIYPNIKK